MAINRECCIANHMMLEVLMTEKQTLHTLVLYPG